MIELGVIAGFSACEEIGAARAMLVIAPSPLAGEGSSSFAKAMIG
jgi:hypothetical protein